MQFNLIPRESRQWNDILEMNIQFFVLTVIDDKITSNSEKLKCKNTITHYR